MESRKTVQMNWFARHRCTEQTYGQPRGERGGSGGRGGDGMNWEIGIDIYTLICIKQITNENLCIAQGTPFCCTVETNTTL